MRKMQDEHIVSREDTTHTHSRTLQACWANIRTKNQIDYELMGAPTPPHVFTSCGKNNTQAVIKYIYFIIIIIL